MQTAAGENECSHYPLPEPVRSSPTAAPEQPVLSKPASRALCPQHKQLARPNSGLFSLPTQARSDRYWDPPFPPPVALRAEQGLCTS